MKRAAAAAALFHSTTALLRDRLKRTDLAFVLTKYGLAVDRLSRNYAGNSKNVFKTTATREGV
jgi:hypothetical protein